MKSWVRPWVRAGWKLSQSIMMDRRTGMSMGRHQQLGYLPFYACASRGRDLPEGLASALRKPQELAVYGHGKIPSSRTGGRPNARRMHANSQELTDIRTPFEHPSRQFDRCYTGASLRRHRTA